jgi:hypothetical protein
MLRDFVHILITWNRMTTYLSSIYLAVHSSHAGDSVWPRPRAASVYWSSWPCTEAGLSVVMPQAPCGRLGTASVLQVTCGQPSGVSISLRRRGDHRIKAPSWNGSNGYARFAAYLGVVAAPLYEGPNGTGSGPASWTLAKRKGMTCSGRCNELHGIQSS